MFFKRMLPIALAALVATMAISLPAARAEPVRVVGPTPPRLSFVDGDVSFWRPGAEDWTPAQVNTPLTTGDSMYAGNGGNLEIEIGTRAYLRAGSGTEIGIESLETGYLQIRVPAGHAALDLKRLPDGQEIEVDTPNGAFLIDRPGYYRLDVDDDTTTFVTRRGGEARVIPAGGESVDVPTDQRIVVRGTETATVARVAPAGDDAWDRWNYDRTAQLGEEPRSSAYVPRDVAGVDDLDRYGDWRDTPKYGHVWVPRDVQEDWAPYSTGRWVWDGYYGWTWVDDSPWGWAPYHYGRWCWNDGYWGWAPGPVAVRPVYAPALVAFFSGHHGSVSVGLPAVSWVALGWGEPVVPWWGPVGFVGRPYWSGWGGPRLVNNVVINNTTIVNVKNIHRYDNFRNNRAVIGVAGDRFGRGRVDHIRVNPDQIRNLRPVRGELGVRPVRESLVPRAGRGERPPDRIQNRRVVATRPPQDPSRLPRAAGLIPAGSRQQTEPRIVWPDQRGNAPSFGRQAPPPGVERGAVGEGGRRHGDELERRQGRPNSNEVDRQSGRPGDGRAGTVGDRGNGSEESPSTIDRVPGRDRGRTHVDEPGDAPAPPAMNDGGRIDRNRGEHDRNGRERGALNVRDSGGAPEPPPSAVERMRQPDRGPRPVAPPPSNDRSGAVQERGRSERPVPAPEIAPMQALRRNVEPPSRNDREPTGDGGRSHRQPSVQRGAPQRESAASRRAEPSRAQRGGNEAPQRKPEAAWPEPSANPGTGGSGGRSHGPRDR